MRSKIKVTEVKADYIKRINIVMDFIERNLDKELSLTYLSEKACFSPFHFHRIFQEIVGETLNSFIIRKRIEKIASLLLVGTDEPLNDLSLRYGFNSGNAFSRTFKKFYGISPTEFKEKFSKIGVTVLTHEEYLCKIKNKAE